LILNTIVASAAIVNKINYYKNEKKKPFYF